MLMKINYLFIFRWEIEKKKKKLRLVVHEKNEKAEDAKITLNKSKF